MLVERKKHSNICIASKKEKERQFTTQAEAFMTLIFRTEFEPYDIRLLWCIIQRHYSLLDPL